MPAYKNKESGSWYVVTQYTDWTGERKQKCKRGFSTRREALEWEQKFQQQSAGDLDMSFEAFVEIYTSDLKCRQAQPFSQHNRRVSSIPRRTGRTEQSGSPVGPTQAGILLPQVHADSQCNLTMYALGPDKFERYYIDNPNENIYSALIPAFKSQPRLIQAVNCPQITENLYLLPGHLDFTENEVQLGIAMQLSSAFGSMENLPGAINYLIEETARKYNIDYVIFDMNPSLSAINQDIFVCSDYFVIPSSPDLFSLMSIDSLCRVLSAWEAWAQKARPLFKDATYPLPLSTPKFLGYTINDFNLSHGRPQYTFREFMEQISDKIVNQLYPNLQGMQMTLSNIFTGIIIDSSISG